MRIGLRRRVRRRWVALFVVAGIVAAALLRAAMFKGPNTLSYFYTTTSLATRADSLLAGCLVGLLASSGELAYEVEQHTHDQGE